MATSTGNIQLEAGTGFGVGAGGVWVEGNGTVSLAGSLTVTGKDVFHTGNIGDVAGNVSGESPDAIRIDGATSAVGTISLSTDTSNGNLPPPANASTFLDGTVTCSAGW